MGKQWGHGFHKGRKEGFDLGNDIGESVGGLMIGEQAWHTVAASIEAIEQSNDLRALMLLKTLQHALAEATGRNNVKGDEKPKDEEADMP